MRRVLLDQGRAPHAATINGCAVTLDRDFHTHLAIAQQGRPSVILLRAQGLDARGQADLIRIVYVQCEDALCEGAAVSADRETIRVRRLPPLGDEGAFGSTRPLD